MSLTVNTINNISFTRKTAKPSAETKPAAMKDDKNPISKSGERWKLITATFVAGLGVGVRLLAELCDGDFLGNIIFKKANKEANKAGKASALKFAGVTVGLLGMFVGTCAILYTLYKAPKIAYQGKVNAFAKGKDMDVYAKSKDVEGHLLEKINEKALSADEQEKEELKEQYMVLKKAKTEAPDFVKLKNTPGK